MADAPPLARQPTRLGHQLRPSRVAAMAAAQSAAAAMAAVLAMSAQVCAIPMRCQCIMQWPLHWPGGDGKFPAFPPTDAGPARGLDHAPSTAGFEDAQAHADARELAPPEPDALGHK